MKIARGIRFAVCHRFYSNCRSSTLPKALKLLGDLKTTRQVIHTVKYVDELVLLAKEQTVLQCVIGRVNEFGKSCGLVRKVNKICDNEYPKTAVPNSDYGSSITTEECAIFSTICVAG